MPGVSGHTGVGVVGVVPGVRMGVGFRAVAPVYTHQQQQRANWIGLPARHGHCWISGFKNKSMAQ